LYRVARSVLLNDQEAEDVVQETFIRAFTRLVGFRGESRLSTWLTRIALNESRRSKRSHRHQLGLKCWIRPAVNVMRKSTILSSTQSKTLSARLLRTKFEWFWSEPSMGYLTHSVQFS
jgi:RNA polymerase sigma factor (sigma-70 family)